VSSKRHIAWLCLQILKGMEVIHGSNLLHRDLKPGNILLTAANEVRIIDFGVAKHLPTMNDKANTFNIGTPGYQPPEVLDRS
jgi:serine/threonine protein kinase